MKQSDTAKPETWLEPNVKKHNHEHPYYQARKLDLLNAVGKWFDQCVDIGAIDDHCEMGEMKCSIYMVESGSWNEKHDHKAVQIYVKPTFPVEIV